MNRYKGFKANPNQNPRSSTRLQHQGQQIDSARVGSHTSPRINRSKKARRIAPMPLLLVSGLAPFFAGAIYWDFLSIEKFEALLNKIEVHAFSLAGASGSPSEKEGEKASEKSADKKSEKDGKNSSDKHAEAEKNSAGKKSIQGAADKEKKGWTEEEIALFKNLEARKKALDERETDLSKLEEELQKQKKELDERLKQLEQMRQKIAAQLEERVLSDQGKVEKLVAFYSNMKPQSAAKVMQELNEELVVDILGKMKQKNAAEIMNLLAPDKAQRLSEKFAGYKRK